MKSDLEKRADEDSTLSQRPVQRAAGVVRGGREEGGKIASEQGGRTEVSPPGRPRYRAFEGPGSISPARRVVPQRF